MNDPTPLMFPDAGGYKLHLMRVKPRNKRLMDPITHAPIFEALWEVDTCMGDDVWVPLAELRERLLPFTDETRPLDERLFMADLTISQVLSHPQTPYGLGAEGGPDNVHPDIVYWRSGTYSRADDGVLTLVTGIPRHTIWSDARRWRTGTWLTRRWARREGLLP